MTLRADSKRPAYTWVDVAKGTQLFAIDTRAPLVRMAGDYTLTSLGTGDGYDLIVVTTGGVMQYALVLSKTATNRRPADVPAIPLVATEVSAVSSLYPWVQWGDWVLAGLAAFRVGSSGPVFLLVHGGPEGLGLGHQMDLLSLGQRIAGAGGQAFGIEYRVDTWQNARDDVAKAAAEVRAEVGSDPIIVAHSFGGYPASLAFLAGAGRAYAAINAVSSSAGFSGMAGWSGVPDPIALAALRPSAPVAVITGTVMPIPPADDKAGFLLALHNAGHPGINQESTSDHTGTLMLDSTTSALFALASFG